MWPFKKKNTDIKFNYRFEEYGTLLEDFIVFCGLEDEKIQKEEKVWLSWQAVKCLLENSANLSNFSISLDLAISDYIKNLENNYEDYTRNY